MIEQFLLEEAESTKVPPNMRTRIWQWLQQRLQQGTGKDKNRESIKHE